MVSIWALLTSLRQDRRAVTALEYGIIAAAVVAIGLAGFNVVGDSLNTKVTSVAAEVAAE